MSRPITPELSVDIIIELPEEDGIPIVLIRRKFEPLGRALPGGFVDPGETVARAAIREAKEETGLDVELTSLLGVYSRPDRDPRGHTVSVVFVGRAVGMPRAGDDAAKCEVWDPAVLPANLVFDHGDILADYLGWRRDGLLPEIDLDR